LIVDDLYHERLAGAQVGDVFSVDNTSDALTLQLKDSGGLEKASGKLGVSIAPTGPITGTSSGLDVSLASTTKKGACPALPNDVGKVLSGIGTWVANGGAGTYVAGPAGAVDSNIAEFDTATGKLIKDGSLTHANVASAITNSMSPSAGWSVTAGYTVLKTFNPETATLLQVSRVLGTLLDLLISKGRPTA
jgi:hypothetical protein